MELKVNESIVYYELIGHGKPFILLHGFLECSKIWESLVNDLSSQYQFILIDLPGHGKSDVVNTVNHMETLAETVKTVMDELEIKSAHMMGHSLGGYVALAFAELYNSNLDSLILLNSTPEADSIDRQKDRDRALDLIEKSPDLYIRMAIQNLFSETSREVYSKEIDELKERALAFPRAGISAMIRGMKIRKDRKLVLKGLNGKKILISSNLDPLLPIDKMQSIGLECFTTIKVVPQGHMSWLEAGEYVRNIMHFID